jgi:uncharacterized repeat protein (TIGR01451 family)
METITCTVGTMAPGDTGQIVIVVLVDPALEDGSLLQNTVMIYDTETYDPDTSNNTDMVINAVGASADLEITKTAEPVIALKGQTIAYTIVVTNNGPSDAYGAQIFDYFPAELADVTWECDVYPAWGMCPASGSGDIEEYFDLKVGRSLTFTVTGVLTTNWPITNEACVVVPPGVVDPYPDNNCDDVTNEPFHSLFPIVFGPAYRVMKPDLVVTCLEVRPFSISLIIKNNGLAPVTEGFWLDIYLDPDYVPTAVNQPWYDVGDQGLVWGITQPLAPGQSLSMTLDSSYFGGRFGYVEWPIEPGTVAFAQVDSYNPYNSDGAVIEDHEVLNGFYNNIFGPVLSVDATDPWTRADVISALEAMDATMLTEPIGLESLPER